MQHPNPNNTLRNYVVSRPLDPEDATAIAAMRAVAEPQKGKLRGIAAREPFNALMEGVSQRADVTFEAGAVGGVPGIWVHPANSRPDEAIIHLHGGWFNLGTATAFRHLVSHIAARAGVKAFIPDYRLAPEYPFPAAVDDVIACYRGLDQSGIRRIAVVGDSAGGNLALVLALRVASGALSTKSVLVGAAALSPITDLTLSGATYETRADADPFFTRSQASEFVGSYLGSADPKHPLASPLYARFDGLAPVRIHVGDAEVLLDDSRRFVDRAVAAGVDATLDIWMGMPHGFAGNIGSLKASAQALDAIGMFLMKKLATDIDARGQAEQALRASQAAPAHVTQVMSMGELTAPIAGEANTLRPIRMLGAKVVSLAEVAGGIAVFTARSLAVAVSSRRLARRVARAIQEMGIRCVPVILVVGIFTGLVLGLQGYYELARFGSKGALGTLVALTLIRELAPVLAAMMIVGQAGSALASELGIQRNTEQITALETMAIDPLGYLVAPRLLAALVVFPILTVFFTIVGVFGGWLSGSMVLALESGVYWSAVNRSIEPADLRECLAKAFVFGLLAITICAYSGYLTRRSTAVAGARAVAKSATSAVVWSSIAILAADYVITSFVA